MAWHLIDAKLLPKPMLTYSQLEPREQISIVLSQNLTIYV